MLERFGLRLRWHPVLNSTVSREPPWPLAPQRTEFERRGAVHRLHMGDYVHTHASAACHPSPQHFCPRLGPTPCCQYVEMCDGEPGFAYAIKCLPSNI